MKKFARASVVTGAASAAFATVVGLAPTASAASLGLRNGYDYCLGSLNGDNRTSARTWNCNGNPDQLWTFKYDAEDVLGKFYQIVNRNGQCLGILNGDTYRGATASVWDCNGNADQKWYRSGTEIVNRKTKMCLAGSGSFGVGAGAIQWSCNGHKDQKWSYA
ncbi:RICIN domain-containing protein [Streptomyces avermitilis]